MEDNVNNTSSKKARAIAIEIGIVAVLVVAVIAILNYLKLIDVASIFPKNSSSNSLSKSVPSEKGKGRSDPQKLAEIVEQNYGLEDYLVIPYNPTLPKLDVVAHAKAFHYAKILTQLEGSIVVVSIDPGIDKKSGLHFEKRLVVEVGTESAKIELLYPKEAESKIKVIDQNKNVIKFTDLRKGDAITIRTDVAIVRGYPNNINEVVITKTE